MLKSVRIMLAIAAFYDYKIWKMDIKIAFLNGFLKEELYMMQPEGFFDPKGANKVCKLQRSIYGLVQASRSWNKRFDSVIKAFGFVQTFGEPFVTILVQLPWRRNPDFTREPSTSRDASIPSGI